MNINGLMRLVPIICATIGLTACSGSGKGAGKYCGTEKSDLDAGYKFIDVSLSTSGRYRTPTRQVPLEEWPEFKDDLQMQYMETALSRQISYFERLDLRGTIQLGADEYPLSQALESLKAFQRLVRNYSACEKHSENKEQCWTDFAQEIRKKFNLYKPDLQPGDPRFGEDNTTLFTGYYTPLLRVAEEPSEEFPHGIYRKPGDGEKARTDRVGIDFRGVLRDQGLENFFGGDLFDLYLVHVQGSAKVVYGAEKAEREAYLQYVGTNGLKWQFISKYMREKKMIKDGSIHSQRDFLRKNPELAEEVFATCPSYVYLKTSSRPPYGSGNVPVTGGRTIATDRNYYTFKGLLTFVSAARPKAEQNYDLSCGEVQFEDFSRFFIDQDTGGAIRGKGRVDIYFGEGDYAELAASTVVQRGNLFYLMLKK